MKRVVMAGEDRARATAEAVALRSDGELLAFLVAVDV